MSFRKLLSEETGIPKQQLPSSYQVVGDIFLCKFLTTPEEKKKKVALAIQKHLPYIKSVCEIVRIDGEFRQPQVRLLLGSETETLHKEHGILYKFDVSKVMFSKGNLFERKRLLSQVRPEERILDMFAGIGYFSIPLSLKAGKVTALEKNPEAFHYMKENISLNKRQNIDAVNSDCNEFKSGGKFDRILMGYFPETEKFISAALRFTKTGTVIHFHNSYPKNSGLPEKHAKLFGNAEILGKKAVKSLSPREEHVVIDIKIG